MFTRARAHQRKEASSQQSSGEKAILRANDPTAAIQRAKNLHASKLNASDILALQRTIGNRAVQRLLAAQAGAPPVIQTKLMVGAANDHYEQEADRIAQKVTSTPASETGAGGIQRQTEEDEPVQRMALAATITPHVQRQPAPGEDEDIQTKRTERDEGFEVSGEVESRLQASRGSGNPLPDPVRSSMERSFGTDFGNVRLHTDSQAHQLNRGLGARAATHGSNIYFAQGAYNPHSESGRHLLAHELTHVIQQGGARSPRNEIRMKAHATQSSEGILQRVVLDPGLSHFLAKPKKKKEEKDELKTPGYFTRAWNYITGKKQTAYDPIQERQKPATVTSGISATGSVASGVGNLVSVLPSVSAIAASSGGGSAAGVLGAISGPVNAVSGLYNAVKGDDVRQKTEGGLSAVAGLGQTFSGTALAVDSVSKLANVASTGTRFLSAAVLPAQIAMSAVDVVRGTYASVKAIDRQLDLNGLEKQFGANTGSGKFAKFAAQYQDKRRRTAELNKFSGIASLVGASLLLSGVGAPAGIALLALGGVLKVASVFGGWIRDKIDKDGAKKKRDEEDKWTNYVDRMMQPDRAESKESQQVEQVLKVIGMHDNTIKSLQAEEDSAKRLAVIRTLIMRR